MPVTCLSDSGSLGRDQPQARLPSHKPHYSPTDPVARISVKLGKARAIHSLCRLSVDEGPGVISHVPADFADRRASTLLPRRAEPLRQRLRNDGCAASERAR